MAEQWEYRPDGPSTAESIGRLGSALERIAFALERRKSTVPVAPAAGPDLQMIAANLDILMSRVRDLLEPLSATASQDVPDTQRDTRHVVPETMEWSGDTGNLAEPHLTHEHASSYAPVHPSYPEE